MKIGLEVHVALPTKTKLFCSCKNEDSEVPNTNVCPVCMGFPGSKPVLNEEAVRIAKSIAIALGCKVRDVISFVRKVYFYPDLPKDFQITQLDGAIGYDGSVNLPLLGKSIRIRRIQIEEDPAKIIRNQDSTLIDFNRSGVPLVEIVTEPDILSEDELSAFLHELRSILYYQNIDIDREVKADLNISLADERVEVKNIMGIKNIIDAARYEVERQSKLISSGQRPVKETRMYDEAEKVTKSSREKESDEEYGYIYETDLSNYVTSNLTPNEVIIPSVISEKLSKDYNYNQKTILELISLDRNAYSLIMRNKDKYDFSVVISVIEVLKRFNLENISDENFGRLVEISKSKALTKEIIEQVLSNRQVNIVSDEEIDGKILEYRKNNEELFERSKNDKKVINFIIGDISKKYNLNSKDIIRRLKVLFGI